MIVDSMSYEEIAQVYEKAHKENKERIKKQIAPDLNKMRRYLLKNKQLINVSFKRRDIKIGENVTYSVIPICEDWNSFQKEGPRCKEYMSYINSRGLHAVTKGGLWDDIYLFVTAHFLDRYRERCIKDKTKDKKDVLEEFIKNDSSLSGSKYPLPNKPNNVLCCTDRGIVFIEEKTPSYWIANTFITKDMLYDSQQEAVATNEITLKALKLLSENFEYYM